MAALGCRPLRTVFCLGWTKEWQIKRFNMSMRKYLKEVGVTSQQAIERVVREEKLAGKGKLKVKMVLTAEGTRLNHAIAGEIDLSDAAKGGGR